MNPVFAYLDRMRQMILKQMEEQSVTVDPVRLTDVNLLKRHILKRCIHGVDLNPMAVELAKVFGAPFIIHSNYIAKSVRETFNKMGKTVLLFEGGKTKDIDPDIKRTFEVIILRFNEIP